MIGRPLKVAAFILTATLSLSNCASAWGQWLWQIGQDDRQYKEFALAGSGLKRFDSDDPIFLIGSSDPAKDWPFVHPGPADAWAERRAHRFAIAFGLADVGAAAKGACTLSVALVDTHATAPPKLTFIINGKSFEQEMPRGSALGSGSVDGHPERGKPYRFEIQFPAELLKRGPNLIDIVNDQGSWVLYDWLGLKAPDGVRLEKLKSFTTADASVVRGIIERDGKLWQPIEVNVRHVGSEMVAVVKAGGETARQPIKSRTTAVEVLVPAAESSKSEEVTVEADAQTLHSSVQIEPVRKMTVYVLPHSHNDIGYTDLQSHIEQKQMENLRRGMELAEKTVDYPAGARYVWNVEVLWSVDRFLHTMPEADRRQLIEAIKQGHVALNGMYANELTGLCRPEELLQLFRCATELSEQTGIKVDSAMISDVPGMTWGTCTALTQAGIRYFSIAPNYFDRIGSIMVAWQDKPFWWIAPDGKAKVLVWVPWQGYGMSHRFHEMTPQWVGQVQARLDSIQFPYDITYMRWAGHGDNAAPDPAICDFIKSWNARYAWPKFVIASTSEAFSAFEKRYGDRLPQFKGDLTPYWEDGAASSARETAINRNAADRLVQADALFAMRRPGDYPAEAFADAWRNVLLYSEHTWGASGSVTDPLGFQSVEQWKVKQGFALDAEKQSRQLIEKAVHPDEKSVAGSASAVDVFNTTSWPRTELVVVPRELSTVGDRVTSNSSGAIVPSQRLASGELAFLASDIPPFAAARFNIAAGEAGAPASAVTQTLVSLDNGLLHVRLDQKTGDILELKRREIEVNLAGSEGLNQYAYLPGDKLSDLQSSSAAKITAIDKGPLVASLRIESDAPGCNKLTRELRLVAGADDLEIANTLDKTRAPINPNPKDRAASKAFAQHEGKESLSFAFPFNVPDGQVRLDIPFTVLRPNADQLPGACKNWLPVGRFADVSNDRAGVTLATLDAPLVELGKLSTLLGSQSDPEVWRKEIEPTQKIYSWVMNNHWSTNYRAFQDGVVTFRYALRPHDSFSPADAKRFAIGLSQPLILAPAPPAPPSAGAAPSASPLLSVEPADVLVTTLKPADDGKGLIVRLFGASGEDRQAKLRFAPTSPTSPSSPSPIKLWLSDTSEKAITPIDSAEVPVPGWGVVTVRAQPQ